MYVPLGLLSIATVVKERLGDRVDVAVWDEDVEAVDPKKLTDFDVAGFYSTSFNYRTCVEYASLAQDSGVTTVLGGPHASVLSDNIMRRRDCFDYLIRFEGEIPFTRLIDCLIQNRRASISEIPNLVFKEDGKIVSNPYLHENDLAELPIPSRAYVPFERYVDNFRRLYPEKAGDRPGSLYSSKGCSWRDKTGGCVFCARLEKGVRFRDIDQIWTEIRMLQERHSVNSVWDISDDNLNNLEWFKRFVGKRPDACKDLSFFVYSRVNFITEESIRYLAELNVQEVFIGVESGDNAILKGSFKGQTVNTILRAVKLLRSHNMRYFPSFILGLPGESEVSMANTHKLCQELGEIGGLDRLGCTILQPIPGSEAYDMILRQTEFGKQLKTLDDVDLLSLEKRWIEEFTHVDYETAVEYRAKINETMRDVSVFGQRDEGSEVEAEKAHPLRRKKAK
jgi:radical SAM superfamily enzyme YgiQ (UPF0313 family)